MRGRTTWFAAVVTATLLSSRMASAAECRNGRVSITYGLPPDCRCYAGSSRGTRVYATIKNVIVTLKQTVRVLPGDAVVSCDARHVVVVSHRDRLRHVFPIEANVEDVYTPNVVFGVFPWVGPDPELKRRIRDGSAVLLRVY